MANYIEQYYKAIENGEIVTSKRVKTISETNSRYGRSRQIYL